MKYLFPITYFNAFEKRLPDETDFERMIASKSYKECLTVLQDTHYAEFASQEFSLEEIVNKEKKSFRKDLFKIGLSKEVLEFLYLKFDLFNLGLELKREIFGVDYSKKDLVEGSGLKIEKLKEKYCSFVEKMKNNPPKDLTKMDEKIMSFYFEKSIRISKEQGDERLEDFFESYKNVIKEGNSIMEKLDGLEKKLFESSKWNINGLNSIFSFFLKRKKAEKKIKIILSSKEIKLEVEKINKLINYLPALI